MDREKLKQHIMKARDCSVSKFSENDAKRYIIEPIFSDLGWDTHDAGEVRVEYNLLPEGRVDYAFFVNNHPFIFVEAKAPKLLLEHYESQLLKYAFSEAGVKLAVLTNGLEWWLYLPWEVEKNWCERRFYSVDLKKQNVETICDMLNRFLGKENVLSGEALSEAKNILTNQPPPPTGEKKARYYGEDRKPKIPGRHRDTIDSMTIELLKEGPKTPEELVEAILKKFPSHDPNVLLHTTIRRLRGYLRGKHNVNIEKDDKGQYFIK